MRRKSHHKQICIIRIRICIRRKRPKFPEVILQIPSRETLGEFLTTREVPKILITLYPPILPFACYGVFSNVVTRITRKKPLLKHLWEWNFIFMLIWDSLAKLYCSEDRILNRNVNIYTVLIFSPHYLLCFDIYIEVYFFYWGI